MSLASDVGQIAFNPSHNPTESGVDTGIQSLGFHKMVGHMAWAFFVGVLQSMGMYKMCHTTL